MGIRELQKLQAEALEAYHAEHERLENEIEAIRTKRGTKLKEIVPTAGDAELLNIADGRSPQRPNGNW